MKSFLQRVKKHDSHENIKRSGRPRKSSSTDDRLIVRKALANTRLPLKQLRVEANSNLSNSTLRRRLREANIKKRKAVKRPRLNKEHASKHLKWAKEHRTWKWEDWIKVGWSDECSVEKGVDARQVWVFRPPGEAQKYLSQNVAVSGDFFRS